MSALTHTRMATAGDMAPRRITALIGVHHRGIGLSTGSRPGPRRGVPNQEIQRSRDGSDEFYGVAP
jgi:hypothetical protein